MCSRTVPLSGTGGANGGLRHHSLRDSLCQCVRLLPAAGPVTVEAGRHAEVPPSGLPHSDLARARVRVGGGKDNKGPHDRHAVA